jgi:hypothetical protein
MDANLRVVRLWSIFAPVVDLMNHLGLAIVFDSELLPVLGVVMLRRFRVCLSPRFEMVTLR